MGRPPSAPPPCATGKLTSRPQTRHLSPSPWPGAEIIVSVERRVWSGESGLRCGVASLQARGFVVSYVCGSTPKWRHSELTRPWERLPSPPRPHPTPHVLKILWVCCRSIGAQKNVVLERRNAEREGKIEERRQAGTRDAKAHRNARPSLDTYCI